jgi:hypothetical protein
MRPFFTYFGGKWRAARSYPDPLCSTIVEPFAGAAGYSMRHAARRVILIDLDPVVAGVWRYLIAASASEIRSLPLLDAGQSVDDLNIHDEARWLVGFWCNKGSAQPRKTISAWGRDPRYSDQFWGEKIRERVAGQVDRIRHWQVIEGDYTRAPDIRACWFIDPPYQVAGKNYKVQISDYSALGEWCRSRQGQVTVCESSGADWLPFRDFLTIKANESAHGGKVSREAIWTSGRGQTDMHFTSRGGE